MKVLAIIVVALAVCGTTSAYVTCTKQFCDLICSKPPTPEDCRALGKEFRPNAAPCNCCDTCVDYIPLMGYCGPVSKSPFFSGGFSVPEKHCAPGSSCIDNHCLVIME